MKDRWHKGLLGISFAIACFFIGYGSAQAQAKPWAAIGDPAQRFQVLASYNSEAVLDRETGLVWQRTYPVSQPEHNLQGDHIMQCARSSTGGRTGWRLPKIEELYGLLVKQGNQFVFPGSPFIGNLNNTNEGLLLWSSSVVGDGSFGIGLNVNNQFFNRILPDTFPTNGSVGTGFPPFCVRGGANSI